MQDYKVTVTVFVPVKATSAAEAIERVREAWDSGCEYGEPRFDVVDDDAEIKLLERLIEAHQAEDLT